MKTVTSGLQVEDTIDVMYLCPAFGRWTGTLRNKWYRAEIIHSEDETWPIAWLRDGQWTEVRPHMPWRLVAKAPEAVRAAIAA
jgi:hypothetical protein